MLVSTIIQHCSPVLAGLKTANLFNYFTHNQTETLEELNQLNIDLNPSDIYFEVLKQNSESMLIYIYRKTELTVSLSDSNIKNFLSTYGYTNFTTQSAVSFLKHRILENSCFPHEIGIFLGYPFEDVIGFIENKGLNYKLCGHWKVYCNEEYAKKCFARYKKCTEVYTRLFNLGKKITDLSVVKRIS